MNEQDNETGIGNHAKRVISNFEKIMNSVASSSDERDR